MAKTHRSIYQQEAPEWFDIEKYDAVEDLDAKGWLYQLSSRLVLDVFWQPPPDGIADQLNGSENNEWTQTAEEIKEAISKEGVLRLPDHSPDRIPDPYDDFFGAASFGYSAVRSLTNFDVYWGLSYPQCRKEILEKIKSYYDPSSCDSSVWGSVNDWAEQVFQGDHHSSTFVGIDLNVNDEQLVDDFKKWLGNARKCLAYPERKRNFTENDFGTWRQLKMLPYIDLQLWARKSGVKYTHNMMANILFKPIDLVGKEKIRKTIKKHADDFISAYPALRAQVEGTLTKRLA